MVVFKAAGIKSITTLVKVTTCVHSNCATSCRTPTFHCPEYKKTDIVVCRDVVWLMKDGHLYATSIENFKKMEDLHEVYAGEEWTGDFENGCN